MISRLDKQQRRALILLCSLVVIALGLDVWQYSAHQSGGRTWFDAAVCTLGQPLQSALLQATRRTEETWRMLVQAEQLAEENARLAKTVAALETRLTYLREGRRRAEREHALRWAYPRAGHDTPLAHIAAIASGGWCSYFTVDRGGAEGVRVGDVAVTHDGVVGQVYAVSDHTARLLPFTDPASGIAVRVERSRDTGVVKGLGEWQCEVRYLEPDAELRPGDQVLTSGTGGIFPEGLPVGMVTSVRADPYTPGKVAAVQPAADLRKVEEVLLLRGR